MSCAPALFQKIINQTIADIFGIVCYLDDIIVTGKMDQEHTTNLQKALKRLKVADFQLKREKCKFFNAKFSVDVTLLTKKAFDLYQRRSKLL